MNRMLLTLATAAGLSLFAGTASADPGGFAPPKPQAGAGNGMGQIGGPGTLLGAGQLPPGRGPDMYGWNPSLKKLFHHGHRGGCPTPSYGHNPLADPALWAQGGYGQGGPAYNPQGFPPGMYGPNGPMMQGTLAFPHHPFVRSPRDFFMLDVNK